MNKLTNLNNLERLSKSLDARYKELIIEETNRASAEEQSLQTEVNVTKEMLGGKSIRYVTQTEYDALSDEEKDSSEITYFITDAVDLSHSHENKEFLDNLAARNITIGNKSQLFNGENDLVYSIEDMGVAPTVHNHDDMYYTETEINSKIEDINEAINEQAAGIQSLINNKADLSYVNEKLGVVDAITLNGYSIWVGTTEELNAIENRDPYTIYFEIGDEENTEQVVQINPVSGVLEVANNKYQKATITESVEVAFPTVTGFAEIHLYLDSTQAINFRFPNDKTVMFDRESPLFMTFANCKWRTEPNIEDGLPYEIIMTNNSIEWLVEIVVYS